MSVLLGLEDDTLNPLKRLRLETNKTPELFAKEAGIQLAAVGQAEEGFYPHPLPSYLIALGITPGSSYEYEVTEEYHEYQIRKRKANGANGNRRLILDPVFSLDEHPLVTWRRQSGLATYGFCSAFCIHMPSVNNFEKNILEISKIPPTAIEVPLLGADYDLTEFTEACILYKTNRINRSRRLNNLPPVG
jgi:hypothetical protein